VVTTDTAVGGARNAIIVVAAKQLGVISSR
jgi:hypothetical protein